MIYLSIFIIYVIAISFLSWLANRPEYENPLLKFSQLKSKPRPLTEYDKLYGQGSEIAMICNNLKKQCSTDNVRIYPISTPCHDVEFGESFELEKPDGTKEIIEPARITHYKTRPNPMVITPIDKSFGFGKPPKLAIPSFIPKYLGKPFKPKE